MASEVNRNLTRILLNYLRLGTTLGIGLIFVPFALHWVGNEGFGLIALVSSTVEVVSLQRFVFQQSLVRELGVVYHSNDDRAFREVYNSSFLVAVFAAVTVIPVYGGLLLALPLFNLSADLVPAARWMLGAHGVFAIISMLLCPAATIYLVKEQFGWVNFWRVCIRATELLSALFIYSLGVGILAVPLALKWYGILQASSLLITMLFAATLAVIREPKLVPTVSQINPRVAKRVAKALVWNSGVYSGTALIELGAVVLMNLAFGLTGNTIYAIAFRLVSYTRMAVTGVTHGLEAVATRISSTTAQLRDLVQFSTRIHAIIAIPGGVAVVVLASPCLQLWIGRSVEQPQQIIFQASILAAILSVGVTARAIADGLMAILYGSGHVDRYAPLIIAGGVIGPLLSALLLLLPLPSEIRYTIPSLGFTLVYTVGHFLILPYIASNCLSLRYSFFFKPLIRPLGVTAVGATILLASRLAIESWSLVSLGTVMIAFSLFYGLLTWLVVFDAHERTKLLDAVGRLSPLRQQKRIDDSLR